MYWWWVFNFNWPWTNGALVSQVLLSASLVRDPKDNTKTKKIVCMCLSNDHPYLQGWITNQIWSCTPTDYPSLVHKPRGLVSPSVTVALSETKVSRNSPENSRRFGSSTSHRGPKWRWNAVTREFLLSNRLWLHLYLCRLSWAKKSWPDNKG